MKFPALLMLASPLLMSACAPPVSAPASATAAAPAKTAGPPVTPAAASNPATVIAFLGDSLTAGYDLELHEAFPALIGESLRAEGVSVRIINAGSSGDTSSGGLARADWVLSQRPDIVVISLGANDGLRGLSNDDLETNLRALVSKARAAGARPILAGMLVPPNHGGKHALEFAAVFPRVASEMNVPLVKFLLEGVALDPAFNLEDGMHPNAAGQRRLAATVLPVVRDEIAALARAEVVTGH